MDAQLRQRYMQAMGIPVWIPKPVIASQPELDVAATPSVEQLTHNLLDVLSDTVSLPSAVTPHPLNEPTSSLASVVEKPAIKAELSWDELQDAVRNCQKCALSHTRTQTVFGTGSQQAQWMIIGEAPGAEEDRKGIPFVGKAGQLLNNMLAAVGVARESVYIANVLKCRPPNNRDPKPEEVVQCRGYLERQIDLVTPRLILVVGRIAAQNLLQTQAPLARLRNQVHHDPVSGIPVIVTYHPAYLLRQPLDKRKAWQDLQFAKELFAQYGN